MTSGCLRRALNRSIWPGCGAKSVRWVSTRPEVQAPAPSLSALISRKPWPLSATFAVEALIVSTSPVPQLAAPPG